MLGPVTMNSLPNEILLSILPHLSNSELLSLATVNRRLYSAAVALLHDRLVRAASVPNHELQLECFTPAQKLVSEPAYCEYIGTDALPVPESDVGSLAGLNRLYSHFRPVQQRQRPWWTNNNSNNNNPDAPAVAAAAASETIHLDEQEPFAQLCTLVNIVRHGPRRGLLLGLVNVEEGLIRVWRDWLARRAGGEDGDEVLWADARRDVGIRFGRVERKHRHRHQQQMQALLVLSNEDEDEERDTPVSYRLEFTELLVRTSRLLVSLEEAETKQVTHLGNAIVIASITPF